MDRFISNICCNYLDKNFYLALPFHLPARMLQQENLLKRKKIIKLAELMIRVQYELYDSIVKFVT
jgi:hypothetical protein